MSFNFKTALTPKLKDGSGLDQRYSPNVSKAIELAGKETIDGLLQFYTETNETEKKYSGYAYQLARSLFSTADEWQIGPYRKQLTPMLAELGFKPSKISKIIGAAQFADKKQKEKSDSLEWLESLSTGLQYECSRLSEKAYLVLWAEVSNFGENSVTRDQIIETGNKHEHTESELRKLSHFGAGRPKGTSKPFRVSDYQRVPAKPSAPVQQPTETVAAVVIDVPAETVPTGCSPDTTEVAATVNVDLMAASTETIHTVSKETSINPDATAIAKQVVNLMDQLRMMKPHQIAFKDPEFKKLMGWIDDRNDLLQGRKSLR